MILKTGSCRIVASDVKTNYRRLYPVTLIQVLFFTKKGGGDARMK